MHVSPPRALGLALLLASQCAASPFPSSKTKATDRSRSSNVVSSTDAPSSTAAPSIVTTPVPTSTTPVTTPQPVAPQSAIAPYLYGCNAAQSSMVSEAWAEASQLAVAGYDWSPPGYIFNGAYQDAMDMYMGTDSRNDFSLITGEGPLQRNVIRQYRIHTGNSPAWTYGYFYCSEDDLPTNKKRTNPVCGPDTTAYTFDDLGYFWNTHYVVFCPTFFSSRMSSLAAKVLEAKSNPVMQQVMDPWRAARARSLFHETYHWGTTVSQPDCDLKPEVYKPSAVVSLAKAQNTATARLNAESWAQSAMAIYLQQTFGLKSPPVPEQAFSASGNVSSISNMTNDADLLQESFSIGMPDWFVPPVANTSRTFNPDMKNVTIMGLSPAELANATANSTINSTTISSTSPVSDTLLPTGTKT